MHRQQEHLQALLEPSVVALGYELVGVEYFPQRTGAMLRVYIDSPDGITVDDCERVSHQVSGVLDVEDPVRGGYTLEVSSPGVDRPLYTPEHFSRFAGERVRVRLDVPVQGRRNITGILKGFSDGKVIVLEDGEERRLPLEAIGKAKLAPELDFRRNRR